MRLRDWAVSHLLDHLELAEDPLTSEVVYLHKSFQIFSYFFFEDSTNVSSSHSNTKLLSLLVSVMMA